MRTLNYYATVATLCLGLSGCDSDSEPPQVGDPAEGGITSSFRLGMMPKLVGIGYFDATRRGAEEAARELGIDLIYDGPTEARSEDQIRMVDGWLAQGVDVIAIAPNDPEAIAQTLRTAKEVGATVLCWDTDANPETSGRSVFVNQVNNEALGFALVDTMVEQLKARGQSIDGEYLIVSGTATASNQNTWMKFMRQRIDQKYPGMKLLPHLTPGEDLQKAQEQSSEALSAHPNLKGVWGITSVALPGAARAVRESGKAESICVTGLSLPDMMRQYVKDGTVETFLLWDAVALGYLTVYVAQELKNGGLESGTRDFGRLKGIEVRDGVVTLGPPLKFNLANIDDYQF
jgi:ABC-type sugar transport system substrate-binding protein